MPLLGFLSNFLSLHLTSRARGWSFLAWKRVAVESHWVPICPPCTPPPRPLPVYGRAANLLNGSALQCGLSEKKAEYLLLRGICSHHTWCLAVSGCALNSSFVSDSVPFRLCSRVACCGRGHGHVDGKKKESPVTFV